jgi:U3 small nucleolar RNA-associated protein 10
MGPASGQPSSRENIDMIYASSGADAGVRLIAVKELIKSISGKEVSSLEDAVPTLSLKSIDHSSTLFLRKLFGMPSFLASKITTIISSDPQAYISSLSLAIGATEKPKRNFLRRHLTYPASLFWATAEVSELIFHQFIFLFLLFSKPRRKTAELVWEIIGNDLSQPVGSIVTDWLAGCAALVMTEEAPEGSDSVNDLNQLNLSISAKIAGKFLLLS